MSRISFVIATLGVNPAIHATLASIETRHGDEIVVVGGTPEFVAHDSRVRHIPCQPGGDWGHSERNYVAPFLQGDYVAHIDDDDVYAVGHRALMADAIQQAPDRPTLFRMQYPSGGILWNQPILCMGNVGTPMILIPNVLEKFGTWGPFNGGDAHFLQTMGWAAHEINWRPEVTTLLGHNA